MPQQDRPPVGRQELPRPATVRLKFQVFGVLAAFSLLAGMPVWSSVALVGITALIPVAVLLRGGPESLRALLRPGKPVGGP